MSVVSKKVPESEFDASSFDDGTLWPEWSDAILNKENWSGPKNGKDGFFLDSQVVQLPSSLKPHGWIRANNLKDLTEPLTVFTDNSEDPDLISNNKHLLHSEACGRDGLEISDSKNFVWIGRQQPWQGWMNVYSMSKAGKGARHRPILNPNGKYIVRLFVLGSWRRVTVDDFVPVNENADPLLPRTENNYELWPVLLSKALLKVCSLTWSQNREIVDFHPITCLTGWVCLRLDISYLSPQDKWDFLRKYADHFEWTAETTRQESQEISKSITTEGKRSKETTKTKKSKDSDRSKKSKRTEQSKISKEQSEDNARKLRVLSKPQPVTLFLGLQDMKQLPSDAVPGLSPCWSHFIYVCQSRDIPLDPKDVKPPLARWKMYRWLKWAISKGIIDPVEYFVPIRSLKVVSPLRNCEKCIINKYNLEENLTTEYTHRESKNEQSEDSIFWADFNKIEPYVKDIHFFYKLDYFQYTAILSDRFATEFSSDLKSETKKSSRKSSPARTTFKERDFTELYSWPQKMSKSRNEPLFIFTDSLEDKFFLINFSTFQVSAGSTVAKGSYLIVERHSCFHRSKQSHCLVSILTSGTKSTVLELEAGRHLLQIYCRSESYSFITISSDTVFYIGDRKTMYKLMSAESHRIDCLAKRISNSISSAYQSFGTERYLEATKDYYKSYMPTEESPQRFNKILRSQIHRCFVEEKVKLLGKILPAEQSPGALRSLRIFFLNPEIYLSRFDVISVLLRRRSPSRTSKSTEESYHATILNKDKAASVIQSFFKMLTLRKYKRIHDPKHREHQEVLNTLLKIVDLFNYNKRESLANQLLRNMLDRYDNFCSIYSWFRDIKNTLQVQELNGTLVNVKTNQWVPIVRLQLNTTVRETVHAGIDLFISLPKYSLRVFNNETGQELLRIVNNVAPIRYQHAALGYTLFAYGWSEDQSFKELSWTLNIISMKGKPALHFINDRFSSSALSIHSNLTVEELSYNYIPNSRNYISKWIIKVVKRTFVSFRLRTSYDQVKIKFKVTDEQGNTYSETRSKSAVIVPSLCLGTDREPGQQYLKMGNDVDKIDEKSIDSINIEECEEEGIELRGNESKEKLPDDRIYIVEAFVLDDSWPLTKSEWAVAADAKAKAVAAFGKSKSLSATSGNKITKSEVLKTRKGSKEIVDSSNQGLEAPYWVLQVVTNSGSGLEISQDRTKERQLAEMKESWAKENPESLQRGRQLREAFLSKYEIKSESSVHETKRKSSVSLKRDSHRKIIVDCSDLSIAKEEVRTLKRIPTFRTLPLLNLSDYRIRDDEEEMPWVKTEMDEETLRTSREMNIIYAKEDYTYHLQEIQSQLKLTKERYKDIFNKYRDSFWESRALLEDIYEARKDFVSNTRPVKASSSKRSRKSSGNRSTKSRKV